VTSLFAASNTFRQVLCAQMSVMAAITRWYDLLSYYICCLYFFVICCFSVECTAVHVAWHAVSAAVVMTTCWWSHSTH